MLRSRNSSSALRQRRSLASRFTCRQRRILPSSMPLNPTLVRPGNPLWALSPSGLWIAMPLVALTYASVAALCLAVAISPGYASALWPPAGIALAAWLAYGGRIWPGILLGAAVANLGVGGTTGPVGFAIGAGDPAPAALARLLVPPFLSPLNPLQQTPAGLGVLAPPFRA